MTLEQDCRKWLEDNGQSTIHAVNDELVVDVGQALSEFVRQKQREVLDLIANTEGWEESRNHYAKLLGLPEIEFKEEL
jgi:hypothetical protein